MNYVSNDYRIIRLGLSVQIQKWTFTFGGYTRTYQGLKTVGLTIYK